MMKNHTTSEAMTEYINANLQYRELARVGILCVCSTLATAQKYSTDLCT